MTKLIEPFLSKGIQIQKIGLDSKYLEDVKKLWRINSQTLGFFTEGAFRDHASKNQIIIAVDEKKYFLGYLIYRVTSSKNIASIVHLCVISEGRNLGIASLLVKELVHETSNLKGIGLYCRRDFSVSKLWSKLNFKPRSEKVGKSISGSTLTYWWFDHNHPDLFTNSKDLELSSKEKVVIDANIFYDIQNQSNEESLTLVADFLKDVIALCITDEIFIEIERSNDQSRRTAARTFSTNFHILHCPSEVLEGIDIQLKKYLPKNINEQNTSDFNHLAKAIAANAKFFITRDENLLKKSNEIYHEFGITIFRPSELITQIDSLYRKEEYQPERLGRTIWNTGRIQPKQTNLIADTFQNHKLKEKKFEIKEKINNLLCDPLNSECVVIWQTAEVAIGVVAYSKTDHYELKIPLLRIDEKHTLGSSIAHYLVQMIITKAVYEKYEIIRILDIHLNPLLVSALQVENFVNTGGYWFKLIILKNLNTQEINHELTAASNKYPEVIELASRVNALLEHPEHKHDKTKLWEIESAIWPMKLTDIDIPCFIIAIQPQWAQHLFDKELSDQDLFGGKLDLALNREGVYYRSTLNSSGISAPSRILWYVSESKETRKKYKGVGMIKAHSRLEEVIIDYPKPLFHQFRRLGIYAWNDIIKKAKNDQNTKLMALRFTKTELLHNPQTRSKAQKLLASHGIKTQFLNPCPIPSELFFNLISGN